MSQQTRRVLITGAGSGLGRALAHALRARRRRASPASTSIVERAEATRARAAGQRPPGAGRRRRQRRGDGAAAAKRILREWGGVDVLVNNAGIASGGPMVETTMAEWRQILEVDLLSVVRGCRLFLPGMLAARPRPGDQHRQLRRPGRRARR